MREDSPEWALGYKLNKMRLAEEKTLKEAAEAIKVTPQFISAFEKGRSGISFTNLRKLLRFYNSSFMEISDEKTTSEIIHLEDAEPYDLGDKDIYAACLFKDSDGKQLEPLYYRFSPGSKTRKQQHDAAEFIFMLSGCIDCTLEDPVTGVSKAYHLVKGDSLHVEKMYIHQVTCSGTQTAEVLGIAYDREKIKFLK